MGVIRGYQLFGRPILKALGGGAISGCRFEPSCSQYALEAVEIHGAWRGSWMSLTRISRCHPWGGCGYDPVPKEGEGRIFQKIETFDKKLAK